MTGSRRIAKALVTLFWRGGRRGRVVVFSGNWYDDEAEMFENGVRVEVESRP